MTNPGGPGGRAEKSELRRLLLARRRETGIGASDGEALAARVLALLDPGVTTVAVYASISGEPPTGALRKALADQAIEVLLPVVRGDRQLDLVAAGTEPGTLARGALGFPEPAPPSGDEPVGWSRPDAVIVPGLAGDRFGHRLGRGAGCYDRSLALRRPGVPVFLLLHDHEVLEQVPSEPHDVLVDALITPARTILRGCHATD